MPEFFNVVTPSQALQTLDQYLKPLTGVEEITASEALGRVTAGYLGLRCCDPSRKAYHYGCRRR